MVWEKRLNHYPKKILQILTMNLGGSQDAYLMNCPFKVIRKFFLKHNKRFRWHLGDYEKHIFFPIEGL